MLSIRRLRKWILLLENQQLSTLALKYLYPHQLCKKSSKLYKCLVISILLYGCETWILLADSENNIQAFEIKCLRKLLRISYMELKTNDWVRSRINFLVGPRESLLPSVKRRKLAWFGHVTRYNSLSKTILQDALEGWPGRGRQRKCWMENIKEWTSLPMGELHNIKKWTSLPIPHRLSAEKTGRRISAESSFMSP